LEAELDASRRAYDVAAAAKANAEKSQKAALGKAKKAERALADANKEHAKREQAVAERLRTISTAAESKYLPICLLFSTSTILVYLMTLVSFFLCLLCRIDRYNSVGPAIGR
jgi:hypothetical protein